MRKSVDSSQKGTSKSNSLMMRQGDQMSVNQSVIIKPDSKWKTIMQQQEDVNGFEGTRKS